MTNLTSSKVAVSDGSGGLTASSLNSSNLDYLDITTLGTTEASKVVTSNSSNIINLASNSFINMPTQLSNSANGNYVVNKEYVDSVAEGLHILEPCLVASFSNYVPNTSGSGIGYDHVKMGQGSRLEIDLASLLQLGNGLSFITSTVPDETDHTTHNAGSNIGITNISTVKTGHVVTGMSSQLAELLKYPLLIHQQIQFNLILK